MSELHSLIFPQVKADREESLALHRKMMENYSGPIKVQAIGKQVKGLKKKFGR